MDHMLVVPSLTTVRRSIRKSRETARAKVGLSLIAIGTLAVVLFGTILPGHNVLMSLSVSILAVGFLDFLARFLEFLGQQNELDGFLGVFGTEAVNGKYKVVFFDGELPLKVGSDTIVQVVLPHCPPEARKCGALPKGLRHIVPFEELDVVLKLDRLFRRFGDGVEICLDRYYESGEDLPRDGCLSIGLGFNNLTTSRLPAASDFLYRVSYPDGTDDFRIYGENLAEIDPHSLVDADHEYALLARVLVPSGAAKPIPYLVCAGHTADGTAAACNFLVNNWKEILKHYLENGKALDHHHMAAVLTHPKGVRDVGQKMLRPYFKDLG